MIDYSMKNLLSTTEQLLIQKYQSSALSVSDVASELQVETSDVEFLLNNGELNCKNIGNKKRILISSLLEYMFNMQTGSAAITIINKHKVNDLLTVIIENKKDSCKKLSSVYWYKSISKHLSCFFNNTYIEDVDDNMIRRFLRTISINKEGKKASQHLIKVNCDLLKEVVDLALKNKYITTNPFCYMKKLSCGKKTNSKDKVLSISCIKKILHAAEYSDTYRPMIILLLHTGIRIGELLALSWSDIDRANKILHVQNSLSLEFDEDENGDLVNKHYEIGDTKTVCSVRSVPIDDCVLEALDDWRQYMIDKSIYKRAVNHNNQNIIFVNQFGQLRSYQSLLKGFMRFLSSNGLGNEHITFHMFRHTYASILQSAGVDINIIRELLGHTDIKTTANIYIKVDIAPQIHAVNLLTNAINTISENN